MACFVIAASLGTGLSSSAPTGAGAPSALPSAAVVSARVLGADSCKRLRKAVRYYRAKYLVHWARLKGVGAGSSEDARPTQSSAGSCPRYLAHVLRAKAIAARAEYRRWFSRLYEKWRCIHEHEGRWDSNTGNGYWGGLQMDDGFQRTYGPEFIRRYGMADRWPVWAQLVAAERAFYGFAGYGGRGYSPWGTRGRCGV